MDPMPKPLVEALVAETSYEPGDVVEWHQSGPGKYTIRLKADLTTVNVKIVSVPIPRDVPPSD